MLTRELPSQNARSWSIRQSDGIPSLQVALKLMEQNTDFVRRQSEGALDL
jgi:hypothetical protein